MSEGESDIKRKMVKSIMQAGGYARRIEDQYAVGTFDCIFIPAGIPVFMAEVKIIRGATFGPTIRQLVELCRVSSAAVDKGHVIPVVIGYRGSTYYFHEPQLEIRPVECFSVTTSEMSFNDQLVQYYHSRRK